MHSLRMLGGMGLSDSEGRDVDALLRQPKHFALLVYLALPYCGTWHRRDSILGIFWPEYDQTRARSALRSALYILRQILPPDAIRSRGDDELSLNPEIISSDVAELNQAFAEHRHHDALARFRGEVLPGLHIPDAEAFEKWLEQERRRIRDIAFKAATLLSGELEEAGDIPGAITAARRGSEIDPDDEGAARRWIALLDRAGDRAQAFAVYEKFRNHLSDAFGVRPSAETVALLESVRTRHEPAKAVLRSPTPTNNATRRAGVTEPSPTLEELPQQQRRPRRSRSLWWWMVPAIGLTAVLLFATLRRNEIRPPETVRSLIVLPMSNDTGDSKLDYLASGIAVGIARRLGEIGGLRIHSVARNNWNAANRKEMQRLAHAFGSSALLQSSMRKNGDSLEVTATIMDSSFSNDKPLASYRFSPSSIYDLESRLAAAVAGSVFRTALPAMRRPSDRVVDPESYRLTLEGIHQLLLNDQTTGLGLSSARVAVAQPLFQRAVNIDGLNARAWAGLSSVWSTQTISDAVPFDEGFERATAAASRAVAIDSLQGSAWANLGLLRALKLKDLSAGLDLIRKAEAAEPANPEVFLVKAVLFRNAHLWDEARDAIRVARHLDPLAAFYAEREAALEFCAGRPGVALRLYETELAMNPSNKLSRKGITRSLAMLGRYDEAIASWKLEAIEDGDTAIARALVHARGRAGYWNVRHSEGRKRLAQLERTAGRIPPLRLTQMLFAAGDSGAAYRALDHAVASGSRGAFRLPCFPVVDEYRHTREFSDAINRIGNLRSRKD